MCATADDLYLLCGSWGRNLTMIDSSARSAAVTVLFVGIVEAGSREEEAKLCVTG